MKLKINNKSLIILFSFFCFLFQAEGTSAIGVGAKPSFLDLEFNVGQPKETKILVYNISKEAGIFQVSSDELNDWIKIEPNNFRLEAGESKEVKINILAKEEGKKAINLSVSAKTFDHQNFSVNPGLKIPLKLNIEGQKEFFLASVLAAFNQNFPWVLLGILVISLIGVFLVKYLKKKRKFIPSPPENLPVKTSQ